MDELERSISLKYVRDKMSRMKLFEMELKSVFINDKIRVYFSINNNFNLKINSEKDITNIILNFEYKN